MFRAQSASLACRRGPCLSLSRSRRDVSDNYNRMPVPLGLDVEREGLMGEGRDGGWDGEWRGMAALAHRAELAARL